MKTDWRKNHEQTEAMREIMNPPKVSPDHLSPREFAIYRFTRGGNAALLEGLKLKSAAIAADILKASARRGADVAHLADELAEEAAGGMALKIAELGLGDGVMINMLAKLNIPAEVNKAGYRAAQNWLRRAVRADVEQLAAWHESMVYEDQPGKDPVTAAYDHAGAILKQDEILKKARALIAAARRYAATNPSRQWRKKLATDLTLLATATRYMLSLIGNGGSVFIASGNKYLYQQVRDLIARLEPLTVSAA